MRFTSGSDLAKYLEGNPDIKFVSFEFTDINGSRHQCTYSSGYIKPDKVANGLPFDGSSIKMMEKINNSELIMIPDLNQCYLDPFTKHKTLNVIASVYSSGWSIVPYMKCPRSILSRASDLLKSLGIADMYMMGPEVEYFVFKNIEFDVNMTRMSFDITTCGSTLNTKKGYMTGLPYDLMSNFRSETVILLEELGITCEKHHHEVATNQSELNIAAGDAVLLADTVSTIKYVVKSIAKKNGMVATFMPKPLAYDNGSGMHFNISLWKNGRNLFYESSTELASVANLTPLAMKFIGGILHHCRSLLAFCCPTYNSYRRLVPQFEAPLHITYSTNNRSAGIRIPICTGPNNTRIEFRMPDSSCCQYIAFAAVLLAGIDGIKEDYPLPPQGLGDLFDPSNQISMKLKKAPQNLKEAIDFLERDHHYLTADGVFPEEFIADYIAMKRDEIADLACCPHPKEFMLYYNC